MLLLDNKLVNFFSIVRPIVSSEKVNFKKQFRFSVTKVLSKLPQMFALYFSDTRHATFQFSHC